MKKIHYLLGYLLLPVATLAQNSLISTPLEQQQRVINQQSEMRQQQRLLINQQQEQRRLQQYTQEQQPLLQVKPVIPIAPAIDPFHRASPAVPKMVPIKPVTLS
ncbi:hypothetical protein NFB44_15215 [Yersinia ruckeri]|uniref:hypothetical protein n=1 Tax=Yersinia ruckeri TaxID=29486 RepID=UPI0008FE8A6B|nr:hypothetical protein [Yersinia ruckeri]EKN4689142.1 hypothetical protein [Yersinia ruckeri]MCK8586061.1 hypothetical protein [Yersinia ruckeri]MCW6556714.1 hypothetical protein [Yersinia ruckeri]OJB77057.1 hypothetical protein A9Q62_15495 [Yersinia ruckeri]OJB81908.1 hypothetical protein A9Q60_15145 [Yersinia ruckeri]